MSDLDLTAVISAAAANLYQAERGTTSAISASAMFAAMAEMAPSVARHYLERARFSVEAVAPLIERMVREQVAKDIQALHDRLDETDVWENEGRGYLAEAVEIARGSVSGAKAADHA